MTNTATEVTALLSDRNSVAIFGKLPHKKKYKLSMKQSTMNYRLSLRSFEAIPVHVVLMSMTSRTYHNKHRAMQNFT